MRCALYARSATTDPGGAHQLRELRAYVERRNDAGAHRGRGMVIVAEYIDTGSSGTNSARPRLAALMADARSKKFDVVLVWTLDRWGRSLPGCLDGIERLCHWGIGWQAVGQGLEIGKSTALLALIDALRGWGHESKRERVKAGMVVAKRRDRTAGRPKRVFDHEAVKRLSAEGNSIREIAACLNLSYGTVRRVLTKPR